MEKGGLALQSKNSLIKVIVKLDNMLGSFINMMAVLLHFHPGVGTSLLAFCSESSDCLVGGNDSVGVCVDLLFGVDYRRAG